MSPVFVSQLHSIFDETLSTSFVFRLGCLFPKSLSSKVSHHLWPPHWKGCFNLFFFFFTKSYQMNAMGGLGSVPHLLNPRPLPPCSPLPEVQTPKLDIQTVIGRGSIPTRHAEFWKKSSPVTCLSFSSGCLSLAWCLSYPVLISDPSFKVKSKSLLRGSLQGNIHPTFLSDF